jgi:type VI secretion system protein ImpI
MQKALAKLLDGLSPQSIEAKLTSSAFSSKKARAWEMFVERWDAKTDPYENGMLDVFLAYFSEAYDEATRKR